MEEEKDPFEGTDPPIDLFNQKVEEKDPFEGIDTPVGLTFPSRENKEIRNNLKPIGSEKCIFPSVNQHNEDISNKPQSTKSQESKTEKNPKVNKVPKNGQLKERGLKTNSKDSTNQNINEKFEIFLSFLNKLTSTFCSQENIEPPIDLKYLIGLAILSARERTRSIEEIKVYISTRFAYYQAKENWRNLRQCLQDEHFKLVQCVCDQSQNSTGKRNHCRLSDGCKYWAAYIIAKEAMVKLFFTRGVQSSTLNQFNINESLRDSITNLFVLHKTAKPRVKNGSSISNEHRSGSSEPKQNDDFVKKDEGSYIPNEDQGTVINMFRPNKKDDFVKKDEGSFIPNKEKEQVITIDSDDETNFQSMKSIIKEEVDIRDDSFETNDEREESFETDNVPSPLKNDKELLHRLTTEAIIKTNKGFCTLNEICAYICKADSFNLSCNWKDTVLEILEESTSFIHIPSGNRPFHEGSWTLHPHAAQSHKELSKSSSNTVAKSKDLCQDKSLSPVVKLERSQIIDVLALPCTQEESFQPHLNQGQIQLDTSLELVKCLKELEEEISKRKSLTEQNYNVLEANGGRKVPVPKRKSKTHESENRVKKKRKHSSILPSSISSSPGEKITPENQIGIWRGWDKVSTKRRDLLLGIVQQLGNNLGLDEALTQCEQRISVNTQNCVEYKGLTRVYFDLQGSFSSSQKKNSAKERSYEEYVEVVQHQLQSLFQDYGHSQKEPPYSFTILIAMALMSNLKKKMTPCEIINFIQDKFPFYQKRRSWQNCVLAVLRWNRAFTKRCSSNCTAKKEDHEGCWKMDIDTASEMLERTLGFHKETNSRLSPFVKSHQQKNDVRRGEMVSEIINHQKSGVIFLHKTETSNELKENLNLVNVNIAKENSQKSVLQKMNNTSVIVYSGKNSSFSKEEVNKKVSNTFPCNSSVDVGENTASSVVPSPCLRTVENRLESRGSSESLNNNMQVFKPAEVCLTCQFCESKFSCAFLLECHVNSHLDEPCSPCYLCHRFLPRVEELWIHMLDYHNKQDNVHVFSNVCQESNRMYKKV